MSRLQENLQLAKRAIRYVNKLGITSINVPFRLRSYQKSPLSRFDMFLFCYMGAETHYSPSVIDKHAADGYHKGLVGSSIRNMKTVRSQILQIIHSNDSKSQKKKKLTDLMNRTRFDPDTFPDFLWTERTNAPDETRIRCVRKAIKFWHGNCWQKAAIAATWLLEQTKNQKKIFWVGARHWDHSWTIMGDVGKIDVQIVENDPIRNWDEATVIADGWTGDYYVAKHPFNPLKSGSLPNPFQLWARRKLHDSQTDIAVQEDLEWPPKFSPKFTLDKAALHNRDYEDRPPAKLEGIVDNWQEIVDELDPAIVEAIRLWAK